MNTIIELIMFLFKNKKWFLGPLIFFILILSALLLIAGGTSTLSPFIYAIF